jgi:hypothetical protein
MNSKRIGAHHSQTIEKLKELQALNLPLSRQSCRCIISKCYLIFVIPKWNFPNSNN